MMSTERIEQYTNELIDAIVHYVPKLGMALLTLFIGLWVIRWISVLMGKALGRRNVDLSLRSFIQSLVKISLKILLIVMVAGMLGIQTTSFVALLGAAGLAVGLALQGSLANFAGGVLILLFKPYKVEDEIEAGGHTGKVLEIQIFNTILMTGDGRTIILPNGSVSNQTIVNHSRHGSTRVSINLVFPIEADTRLIRTVALDYLLSDKRVFRNPEPQFLIRELGAGDIKTNLRFFVDHKNAELMKAEVQEKLISLFRENKIAVDDDAERLIITAQAS